MKHKNISVLAEIVDKSENKGKKLADKSVKTYIDVAQLKQLVGNEAIGGGQSYTAGSGIAIFGNTIMADMRHIQSELIPRFTLQWEPENIISQFSLSADKKMAVSDKYLVDGSTASLEKEGLYSSMSLLANTIQNTGLVVLERFPIAVSNDGNAISEFIPAQILLSSTYFGKDRIGNSKKQVISGSIDLNAQNIAKGITTYNYGQTCSLIYDCDGEEDFTSDDFPVFTTPVLTI